MLRAFLCLCCLLAVLSLTGCQDELFPQDAPRSPFSRYNALRGQESPQQIEDPLGDDRPALRARLAPMGNP